LDQEKILCIETSSRICSVALTVNGHTFYKESDGQEHVHAAVLHEYIRDVLNQAEIKASDLQALAIAAGPGSYTGLRIGVAAAKGLCFALDLPLIALNSLEVLAHEMLKTNPGFELYRPVFDARRMEVYTLAMAANGEIKEKMAPTIVDEQVWEHWQQQGKTLLAGDATTKLFQAFGSQRPLGHSDLKLSARYMTVLATDKLNTNQTENIHSYQPIYLKPVHTTRAKDPLAGKRP
jgi:tRNA threonylcarbamoyladenosine biosynthesis protein TsaB